MQYCACGFTDDSIGIDEIAARSLAAVSQINDALRGNPNVALQRPAVDRWSMVEYAAHTRDVLITIRDRTVAGLIENNPSFTPMYRDERIELGLYATDSARDVDDEIVAAQTMFSRLFLQIDPASLDRPRSLWVARPDRHHGRLDGKAGRPRV